MDQIRITSDGLAINTHVYNGDGAEIKGFTAIDISIRPGGLANAILNFENVELDIMAETEMPHRQSIDIDVHGMREAKGTIDIKINNQLSDIEIEKLIKNINEQITPMVLEPGVEWSPMYPFGDVQSTDDAGGYFMTVEQSELYTNLLRIEAWKTHPLKQWANRKTGKKQA